MIIYEATAGRALEKVFERAENVPQQGEQVGLFIPGQKRIFGTVVMVVSWPNGDMPDVFTRVTSAVIKCFSEFDPENWRPPTEQHILDHLTKELI